MSEPIPINDNMPDKLKNAINYLNENNISLTDKIEVDFGEDDDDDGGFDGLISSDDMNDTEFEEDDIFEEDVDLSDLDSIF